MNTQSSKKISVFALVLLITGAIDSVRNLPTTALFGSSLIFFFILSSIIFLIPVALISAELAAMWSDEEGGIYYWVKSAFGETAAFFTIWLQWINTIVWYPSVLSFIAATLAYVINPMLAQNKYYLIGVILVVFWSLTGLALRGLRASAAFASFCALFGMILPMALIVILAVIWLVQQHPRAITLNLHTMLPHWRNSQSWVSLTAIMTSFLGMELAAVHVRYIKLPQKNFPKAMLFSVLLILSTMILGSLAIALVLPKEEINLVDGVMQTFNNFFQLYHLTFLIPVLVFLLLLGSLGSMINWIISPAKGFLLAANNGFLPKKFCLLNRHGVASRILILQAVLVSLFCGAFLLFPGVNAIYWLFTTLSTELYMIMYVLMFAAAWRLKRKLAAVPRPFVVPGGKLGYDLVCLLGLLGCIITLFIGFIPPESNLNGESAKHFRIVFSSGIFLMLMPAILLYAYKKYRLTF